MIIVERREHWIKTSYRDAENGNEIMLTLKTPVSYEKY